MLEKLCWSTQIHKQSSKSRGLCLFVCFVCVHRDFPSIKYCFSYKNKFMLIIKRCWWISSQLSVDYTSKFSLAYIKQCDFIQRQRQCKSSTPSWSRYMLTDREETSSTITYFKQKSPNKATLRRIEQYCICLLIIYLIFLWPSEHSYAQSCPGFAAPPPVPLTALPL